MNNKLIFAVSICLLLGVGIVLATHSEHATTYNYFGEWDLQHSYAEAIDAFKDTYGMAKDGSVVDLIVTYDQPGPHCDMSLWIIKDDKVDGGIPLFAYNNPENTSARCIDKDPLTLKVRLNREGTPEISYWCQDQTGYWQLLRVSNLALKFYEESVDWKCSLSGGSDLVSVDRVITGIASIDKFLNGIKDILSRGWMSNHIIKKTEGVE